MTTQLAESMLSASPLLAATGGPSPSLQWGIILFMTILGLLVTLSPPKRTSEVKKHKED